MRTLSGGNQQKVAIAKWLSRHSEIYLLDEPTVGVDIGSKVEIYTLIGELAARGAGIIVLSSDLPELIGITDRILVLFRGRVIREFISSETTTDEVLADRPARRKDCAMSADIQFALCPSPYRGTHRTASAGKVGRRGLRFGSLLAFAVILVVFSLTAPYFLSVGNIGNVLGQSAISGVLAIGLTVVLIAGGSNVVTGGIDLSLAANMGLSAAVYATPDAAWLRRSRGDRRSPADRAGDRRGQCRRRRPGRHRAAARNACRHERRCRPRTGADAEYRRSRFHRFPDGNVRLRQLRYSGPCLCAARLHGIATAIVQYTPLGLRLYAVGEFPDAARAAGPAAQAAACRAPSSPAVSAAALPAVLSVSYLSGSTTGSGEMLLPVVVTALLGSVFSRRLVPTVPERCYRHCSSVSSSTASSSSTFRARSSAAFRAFSS